MPRRKNTTLDLGEQLTIAHVHDAKAAWVDVMSATGDVTVDGSNLGRVDTAGLQLILALKASLEASSRAFIWAGTSGELKDAATMTDMHLALGIDA